MVKPPPFHGGVPSSILGSATNYMPSVRVGEGAALKAVGLKGLAGSNPVDGAKNSSHQKGWPLRLIRI